MTIIIEDTMRNTLAAWTAEAARAGTASGAVLSPFSTPKVGNNYKQSAQQTVQRLQADGVEVWLDPETHALQMPAVGDFRYYDGWPFWSGQRGDLLDTGDMRDHVERVFAEQDRLGVPHLAPTVLVQSPQSPASARALELAEVANDLDPQATLSIVGDSPFWAAGSTLDGHIGALAQLEPPRWSVAVARSFQTLAVPAQAEEVHGLCRTVRALSEDAAVHISHGDLAGLPAMAAGATSLGTGWDPRQRVLGYVSYEARGQGGDGGQWFQQSTLEGLLSLLVRSEATLLAARDGALAARLLPGIVPPGPREAFLHHAEVLNRVVAAISANPGQPAFVELRDRYAAANRDWADVARIIGTASRAANWLDGPSGGLRLYGQTEGF